MIVEDLLDSTRASYKRLSIVNKSSNKGSRYGIVESELECERDCKRL